jgi:carboxyl-terminal processing protease
MASNLLRSLGLVSAVAIIPAATAGFAAVDVGTYRELEQFMTVFERVRSEYVEQVDDKTLMRGAIDGMLNALDPHSSYLDEKGFRSLMTTTEGEYGGLGLSVTMEDGTVKVIAATEDTPADRAGIKAGDYLTHLEGKLLYGGTLDEAVEQMRGRPGTTIKVTVVRPGRDKPFDVSLTRAIIELKTVKWEIKDRIGIINVNGFDKGVTDNTIAAMAAIEKSLGRSPARLHPRSALQSRRPARSGGRPVRRVPRTRRGRLAAWPQEGRHRTLLCPPGDAAHGLPVIVLVDSGSASAAEIVAGALQEHHRAIVMGERTFGKGSVQTLLPLTNQTALRLTTARYYTPSGKSVQEGGITPDIAVPQLSDPDYKERPKFREADLRRHLTNELKVDDDVIQDDGKPDPRFASTAEQLKKQGIEDYQLHYALQTIGRLGKVQQASAGGTPKAGSR